MTTRNDVPTLIAERFPSSPAAVQLWYNGDTHEVRDAWLMVSNAGTSPVAATVWLVRYGGSPAAKDIVCNEVPVLPNSVPLVLPLGVLPTTSELHVKTSAGNSLVFRLFGVRRP